MAQVIVERAERVDERDSESDSGGSESDSEDEDEVGSWYAHASNLSVHDVLASS